MDTEGKMATPTKGQVIGVRCDVKPGPFSGEHVINLETVDGPISGFVREDNLKEISGQWYVRAIVQEVCAKTILVRISGSFFTTNGLATVDRKLALAA